ncbi:uncharacterized protein BDZ83DRAFT_732255 [Colletotrichum acutatum]|uniref:Wac domain-containing protein n=1 Tax=Glomerella acutata TaxID=27357 RepID=A0AAD8XD87_GLOAC|nr:uncharacterized protein BDZ83DRAFT_732255 [Colletotrichum acutatum]KAK1722922.1 hypothetical protein BDZ83DRAFT_732255 [Colletotrichum acutatum]
MVISTTTLTTVTMAASPVRSFSADKHRPQCVSHDEYIELRNAEDKHLNAELASIRCSVDDVKRELKADIKVLRDDVTTQIQYLEAEIRRSQAFTRNNALKNPTLPIRPVVVYRPGYGILEPEPSRFPRNANEFYSLRDPQTDRHRSMLAYLAVFYDVQLRSAGHLPEEESNSDDSDDDEIILEHPDLVVEKLEDILGLNEDKITKFKERALQMASRAPSKPIKRSQISWLEDGPIPDPRRQRLELRITAGEEPYFYDPERPKSVSSEGLTNAHVGWGTRSTPSSQRARLQWSPKLARLSEPSKPEPERPKSASKSTEAESTDTDNDTHVFTNSPER